MKGVGFLMVYDAASMELLYHASAPRTDFLISHEKVLKDLQKAIRNDFPA